MWILLNDQGIIEEIRQEMRVQLSQNPWDVAKVMLRGKPIAVNTHIRKPERMQGSTK